MPGRTPPEDERRRGAQQLRIHRSVDVSVAGVLNVWESSGVRIEMRVGGFPIWRLIFKRAECDSGPYGAGEVAVAYVATMTTLLDFFGACDQFIKRVYSVMQAQHRGELAEEEIPAMIDRAMEDHNALLDLIEHDPDAARKHIEAEERKEWESKISQLTN